jgi:hypothetical protein
MSVMEPASFAIGETIALRPDLRLPDWSRLSDPVARIALAASMEVAARRKKWAGLSTAEDAVRGRCCEILPRQGPDLLQGIPPRPPGLTKARHFITCGAFRVAIFWFSISTEQV